jgi:hypothetical protein
MKALLVHLDASPRAAERLGMAQCLALRHGAELTAWYAVLPALLAASWTMGDGLASAAALLAEVDTAQLGARPRDLGACAFTRTGPSD